MTFDIDFNYETFAPILKQLVAQYTVEIGTDGASTGVKFAEYLDDNDDLASMRAAFHIPVFRDKGSDRDTESVYLCGHSLGPSCKKSQQYVNEEIEKWQTKGVIGHFSGKNPWVSIDDVLHPHLELLCGARPGEVVAMNTLTVNLNLLLVSFYKPMGLKRKIVIEKMCFPSDYYSVQSHLNLHNNDPLHDLVTLDVSTETIISYIKDNYQEIALILLPGVQYYSGTLLEIQKITSIAKQYNVLIGWDLAHAIGNVPLRLSDWGVDFAVWCSYKYLNGGPGAIGGIYVNQSHHERFYFSPTQSTTNANSENGKNKILLGWWGHKLDTRFAMDNKFDPYTSAHVFKNSNPDVFSIMSLKASLEVISDDKEYYIDDSMRIDYCNNTNTSMPVIKYSIIQQRLRLKSILLTGYMEHLIQYYFSPYTAIGIYDNHPRVSIITPDIVTARGSQLSLLFSDNYVNVERLCEDLELGGFTVDYRKPNVIRAAPVAAYSSFKDVYKFVIKLHELVTAQLVN